MSARRSSPRSFPTGTRILHVRGIVRDCPVERTAPRYGGAAQPQVFTRFTLDLTQLSDGERWTPIHGRLRVIVRGAADAQYGDEIEATVRAGRLPPPGNPGEEDVRLLMDRSGICGVAEVRAPEGIRRIGKARPARPPAGLRAEAPAARVPQGADARRRRPDHPLPGPRRRGRADVQRREFRETGTMHFLAISGLHVALLAACCWWTLGAFGVGLRATSVMVFLVALAFALLSGFEHGVQRSVIMCGVWCGAYLLARKMDFPSGMALALILILLIRPADLYSIGLQLSFAAVMGIWLFTTPLERAIFGRPDALDRLQTQKGGWSDFLGRWEFKRVACASLVVWLTTAPLIAQRFGTFTPIAPIASTLLLPLLPVAVVAGMAGALLGLFSAFAAQPLLWLAGGCAHVLEWACRAAARLARRLRLSSAARLGDDPPVRRGLRGDGVSRGTRLDAPARCGADAPPGVRVPAVRLAAVVRPPPARGRDLGRPRQLHPHAVPGRAAACSSTPAASAAPTTSPSA